LTGAISVRHHHLMRRVSRLVVTFCASAALVLAVTPLASGTGPENGLGAICEHVQGGTWDATNPNHLTCSGRGFYETRAVHAICENALHGFVFRMQGVDETGDYPAGWGCGID
jgi:hypothetical protein